MAPGAATEGRGGLISFTVGSSTSGAGSSIDAIAGGSEVNMVGPCVFFVLCYLLNSPLGGRENVNF